MILFIALGIGITNYLIWKKISHKHLRPKHFILWNTLYSIVAILILSTALLGFEQPVNIILFIIGLACYGHCSIGTCIALTTKQPLHNFWNYLLNLKNALRYLTGIIILFITSWSIATLLPQWWNTIFWIILTLWIACMREWIWKQVAIP